MKKVNWSKVIFIVFIITFAASVVFQVQSVLISKPAVTIQFPNRVQEVLPSVVHIMCDRWQGSGVAISEDIVVTARHVVDGTYYTVTLNDGTVVKGTQAITHKDYDVGFIKVDKQVLKPAKFGSIKDCVLGQPIFIIGSPYGQINFNNLTLGVISGLDRDWDELSYYGEPYGWKVAFTSDAGAHPGNSGGPVFTMDGVVRGLLVGGFSPVLNCSVPSDLFFNDVENIKLMFAFNKYRVEEVKTYNEWGGYNQCRKKNTGN
jgi:S1-C subfamily serine protease